VGWALRSKAGTKKVTLELGGNAAAIVASDADLDYAVRRCVAGGFGYAGQTCISVQRIIIEATIYDEFVSRLVSAVAAIRSGDPMNEATVVGPMIGEKEAARLEQWVRAAIDEGAELLVGGKRDGLMFEPTVVAHVFEKSLLSCEEAFGPIVTVAPFSSWQEALDLVNASPYGLQAGVFSPDIERAFQAFQCLDVGAVIVNDVPTFRDDSMPYGGIKASGSGREGVRYAIEEMTEPRILVLSLG
jgi:glyceraldehyde-3-phosphate dehydrogenase (NADP+)